MSCPVPEPLCLPGSEHCHLQRQSLRDPHRRLQTLPLILRPLSMSIPLNHHLRATSSIGAPRDRLSEALTVPLLGKSESSSPSIPVGRHPEQERLRPEACLNRVTDCPVQPGRRTLRRLTLLPRSIGRRSRRYQSSPPLSLCRRSLMPSASPAIRLAKLVSRHSVLHLVVTKNRT